MATLEDITICDSCKARLSNKHLPGDLSFEVDSDKSLWWRYNSGIGNVFGSIGMFAIHNTCLDTMRDRLRSEGRMEPLVSIYQS